MSESIDTTNIEALLFALLLHKCGDIEEAHKLFNEAKAALKPKPADIPTFKVPQL